jgi:hypothetical protein
MQQIIRVKLSLFLLQRQAPGWQLKNAVLAKSFSTILGSGLINNHY